MPAQTAARSEMPVPIVLDPLMPVAEADSVVRMWHDFGEYPLRDLRSGMRLRHDGDGTWSVRDGERVVATYGSDELRFSASWKGYCFADDGEREAWADHSDDLTLDRILEILLADLGIERPASDADLGRLLIDTHIRFPASES